MNTMKNSLIICMALLSLTFGSCDSILEQSPVSSIAPTNFWKNAKDAEAGLIACYQAQKGSIQAFLIVQIVLGDDGYASRGGNWTRQQTFTATPEQGNVGDLWREMYYAIHRCNDVLENVPNISDPALDNTRNHILGQAHFLRAWSYLKLVCDFGGVPIVKSTSKSANDDFFVKRNTVEEVYEFVLQDFRKAVELCDVHVPSRCYISSGTSKAVLARALMYYVGNLSNAEKIKTLREEALQLCEEVMNDSQYKLVSRDQYETIFTNGAQNTTETLFELSYGPSSSTGSHPMDEETTNAAGNSFRIMPDPILLQALKESGENDIRNSGISNYNGLDFCTKYLAGPVDVVNNRFTKHCNIVFMRLADVYLMRAELLNELGRTSESIPFLNAIRERAGVSPTTATTQADLRLAIENERFLELFFEGVRWYDLVRTGRAIDKIAELTEENKARILWPIPTRELDLNPNLEQNPSY